MGPRRLLPLLLAAALAVSTGRHGAAAALQEVCPECVAEFVMGEDAGAYKDITVPGCGGPCDCSAASSPCFDAKVGAAMKVGSVEHQSACCAMCSQTADCAGWVIASGVSAGTSPQDDKPFCWLKNAMTPVDKAPNRAHGKCVPHYSCAANWGVSFLAAFALCAAAYAGGGSVLGARTSGRAPSLRSHPHHSQWFTVVGLVSDGLAFTRATAQGRRPAVGNKRGAENKTPFLSRFRTKKGSFYQDRLRTNIRNTQKRGRFLQEEGSTLPSATQTTAAAALPAIAVGGTWKGKRRRRERKERIAAARRRRSARRSGRRPSPSRSPKVVTTARAALAPRTRSSRRAVRRLQRRQLQRLRRRRRKRQGPQQVAGGVGASLLSRRLF